VSEPSDHSNAVVRPPIAWALSFVVGLGLDWLYPLPFVPASLPRGWIGGVVFAGAFVFAVWAIDTIRRAGSRVETTKPTTTIISSGPYGFTRNPIYAAMFVGLIGLAVGFDSLWVLIMLVPFYLLLRYGVVAREEAYLERKFGEAYLSYKSRVRRWV
jgi:protein-S-isoprenylcysteine O-methyltransferase Ste14